MKRMGSAWLLGLLGTATLAAGEGNGTEVVLGKLKTTAPAAWTIKKGIPFRTRLYTFDLPKAKGDEKSAELQVIFFGAGSGGGLEENFKRWKGMFQPPKGKSIEDVAKLEKFKVGGDTEVIVLDIQGTYLDKFPPFAPSAKTIPRANYRRVNVIVDSKDGPFFLVLVGPAATVGSHRQDFDKFLKGLR